MANEEQDEATSLYICDEHGYGTTAHSPLRCLFLSGGNLSQIYIRNYTVNFLKL